MAETYTGQVQNGVIVLDKGTPALPEGMTVRIEPDEKSARSTSPTPLLELMDRLDHMPGDPDWPTDAASQHDHYLYGSSKRP
jgi:hypothetical protein